MAWVMEVKIKNKSGKTVWAPVGSGNGPAYIYKEKWQALEMLHNLFPRQPYGTLVRVNAT